MQAFIAVLAATLVGLLLLWVAARGAITVCVLDVTDGRVEVTRGALSPKVIADVKDVVKRPRVARATIRIVRAKDRATLDASGTLEKGQLQQLRNIIGTVPLAKLLNAKRKKS